MLAFSILLALAVGWCAGGKLSRFQDANLKFLLLPAAALFLQKMSSMPLVLCLSYAALFFFLFQNRHLKKTGLLIGLGSLFNFVVIAANGWRMPVSEQAAAVLSSQGLADLAAGAIPMYTLAGGHTRLLFLGDILYFPVPFFQGFASLGDILLAAGLFFCLMAVMSPTRFPRWLRTG